MIILIYFFRSPIVARIDNAVVKLLPPCLCFAECQIVYSKYVVSQIRCIQNR